MQKKGKSRSGFLEYISKRDGVIKNTRSMEDKPATKKQVELIQQLVVDKPDFMQTNEYIEYSKDKTIGNASELITKMEESILQDEEYAEMYMNYIAMRPRVVKKEGHGLFSDQEIDNLSKVLKEVEQHEGIIWTAIISLKRVDAVRLCFDELDSWKKLLRANRNELARSLGIHVENFQWYAAFHDEGHHPHVHVMMYSSDVSEGYMKEKSIQHIRKVLSTQIFKDELVHVYKKQTLIRDRLKQCTREQLLEKIQKMKAKPNHEIEQKMMELARRLQKLTGKKQYGYLSKGLKRLVDDIVDDLSRDQVVSELLKQWYSYKQQVHEVYSYHQVECKHLSEIEEFKSIKNIVVKTALEIDVEEITLNVKTKQMKLTHGDNVTLDMLMKQEVKDDQVEEVFNQNDAQYLSEDKKQREHAQVSYVGYVPASLKLIGHVALLVKKNTKDTSQEMRVDRKRMREENRKRRQQGLKLGGR